MSMTLFISLIDLPLVVINCCTWRYVFYNDSSWFIFTIPM